MQIRDQAWKGMAYVASFLLSSASEETTIKELLKTLDMWCVLKG